MDQDRPSLDEACRMVVVTGSSGAKEDE